VHGQTLSASARTSHTAPIAPPTEWHSTAIRHMVLLGPTASGKTDLACELAARRPEAELVSVDSMSVYRYLDIGTAKPTAQQRKRARYHLLDLVDPAEEFTLRQFQDAAREAMVEIEGQGHRALLVAGTALYLRAIVDDLDLPGRWPQISESLEEEASQSSGLERLYRRLERLDPVAAARICSNNRRRIVRALEVTIGSGRRFSSFGPGLQSHPATRFVMVGIAFDPAVCDLQIETRWKAMLESGLLDEVRELSRRQEGVSRTARQALGYRELLSHVEDGVPLEEAVSEALRRTKAFARRQWRWFRRDPRVIWLDSSSDPVVQLLELWDATSGPTERHVPSTSGGRLGL
jgi:tRNA dimethylallyltransferase